MKMSATTVRRGLYGMFAGGLLGGVASAAMIMPTANAEPATPTTPDACTFSSAANTSSTVSAKMSTYLAAHPDANQALTQIAKQPSDEAQVAYRAYFSTNPQVESELKAINQPAADLVSQCGIVIRPTPISEALQGV
ncbi:MAG TPA: heme-binding protein [Mycobacterium sp.]|jgi:hemophore-related protein|nr:heme-binding protein [Mycobacterium sp.]